MKMHFIAAALVALTVVFVGSPVSAAPMMSTTGIESNTGIELVKASKKGGIKKARAAHHVRGHVRKNGTYVKPHSSN